MGKYEEALERARQGLPIDEVFPELKESEDERIRKMLVKQMERWKKCAEDNNVEQDVKDASAAIAYLEKQKEQKPAEIDEYKIIKKYITEDSLSSEVNKRLKECGWYVTYDKPAEWSEEDERNLYNTIEAIKYTFDVSEGSSGLCLINWLKYRFRYQPHWKPSKEQMEILSRFNDPVLKSLHYDLLKLL